MNSTELYVRLYGQPGELADKLEKMIRLVIKIDPACTLQANKLFVEIRNGVARLWQEFTIKGDASSLEKIKLRLNNKKENLGII